VTLCSFHYHAMHSERLQFINSKDHSYTKAWCYSVCNFYPEQLTVWYSAQCRIITANQACPFYSRVSGRRRLFYAQDRDTINMLVYGRKPPMSHECNYFIADQLYCHWFIPSYHCCNGLLWILVEKIDDSLNWMHTKLELFTLKHKRPTTQNKM